MTAKPYRHGAIIGKFLPPTGGHARLIAFASKMCESLTVLVDNVHWQDTAPGIRARWLQEHFGGNADITFAAIPFATPQEPGDHPDFWAIWRGIMREGAQGADVLVASETYGKRLSEEMGCAFLPYDVERESGPISATKVRNEPWLLWSEMIAPARSHYLGRIALEGPESTGKTTIAKAVAHDFGYAYSPEWAKGYIEHAIADREFREEDLLVIARAQAASEETLEPGASRAIVYDSTLLTTIAWGHFLYGRSDPEIDSLLHEQESSYGRKRERIFLTPDVPFAPAAHRNVAPEGETLRERKRFLEILKGLADQRRLPYRLIGGDWKEREAGVHDAVLGIKRPAMAVNPKA